MNDFTKEDLQEISNALFYLMAIFDEKKEKLMAINTKVIEMIYSYCEHNKTAGCLDCNSTICLKCNNRWEYNDNQ